MSLEMIMPGVVSVGDTTNLNRVGSNDDPRAIDFPIAAAAEPLRSTSSANEQLVRGKRTLMVRTVFRESGDAATVCEEF